MVCFYQLGVVRGQPCLPLGLDLESPSGSSSLVPLHKPCCGPFLTHLIQNLPPASQQAEFLSSPNCRKQLPPRATCSFLMGSRGKEPTSKDSHPRPLPTTIWAIFPKEAGGGVWEKIGLAISTSQTLTCLPRHPKWQPACATKKKNLTRH